MATFGELVSNISGDMNRTDLDESIERYINRSIKYYSRQDPFYFNEATGTFSTVASQFIYTEDDTQLTDIDKILMVKIEINTSTNIELTPRTFQYVQRINVNNSPGQPFDYAYYNNSFYIYPVADQAYTVTVYYNKSYAELSNDSDSNDFTTEAEDLIEARTRWYLYSQVIRNQEGAQNAKQEELDAVSNLRTATLRKTGSGKIHSTQF